MNLSLRPHWRASQLGVFAVLLVGYCLMAILVVEQDRTIYSQQALIRTLFQDSAQLANLRMREVQAAAEHKK